MVDNHQSNAKNVLLLQKIRKIKRGRDGQTVRERQRETDRQTDRQRAKDLNAMQGERAI